MNAKAYVFRYFLLKAATFNFHVGELVPSEHKLAQKLGLSRLTIRSVYLQLVNLGLLRPIHGKGYELAKSTSMLLNPLNDLINDCYYSIHYDQEYYIIEYQKNNQLQAVTQIYIPKFKDDNNLTSFDDLVNKYIIESNLGFDEIILNFNEYPYLIKYNELTFNINIQAYKNQECVFQVKSFIKPQHYICKKEILKF